MNKWRLLASKIYRFFFPIDTISMYRKMGVNIGNNCKIMSEVMIDYSHYWHITIGNNVTLAPRVHILAHDASTKLHLSYTKIGKVNIEDNVFIGAGSIILPGVTIGNGAIIGAGSVVTSDIDENVVAAGTPAKKITTLEKFLEQKKDEMNIYPLFGYEYTIARGVTQEMKNSMNKRMSKRYGYIE